MARGEPGNLWSFEWAHQEYAGKKAADVGEERHAATLMPEAGGAAEQLQEEPEAQHHSGGDVDGAGVESKGNEHQHLGSRIEQ